MIREFFEFLLRHKKWWLLPPIIVFAIFAFLIFLTTSSPVSPFIYTLF